MPSQDRKLQEKKILELVQEAIKQDEELREKYNIGNKFRFVRDRLGSLLNHLEDAFNTKEVVIKDDSPKAIHDEVVVYVHLFNAHGLNVSSWQNMLTPQVFYEYSVNRPIYAEKSHIESLLRVKGHKPQNGYLTIAVKREDILQAPTVADTVGNPLVRVKEGALRFERVLSFTHNQQDYFVNEKGGLTRIEDKK
jgi:hypothetical protein